jgi:zinc transport system substrate-binding protein
MFASCKTINLCLLILSSIILGILFTACTNNNKSDKKETNITKMDLSIPKSIVVDLYPIEFLAKNIVKDKIKIINVIKYGMEPHEFELSLNDRMVMEGSNGFLRIGAGIDIWADKINIPNILNLSNVALLHKNGNKIDLHYWSDLDNLIKMSTEIENFMSKNDPENSNFYKHNVDELNKRLSQIDMNYKTALKNCGKKKIVVTHDAYEYIAIRYGFETVSILGVEPENEPSLSKLKDIKNVMKKDGLKVVFLEKIVSSKVPKLIAKETGAIVKPLYSLENIDLKDVQNGVDLIKMLEDNLASLQEALECK